MFSSMTRITGPEQENTVSVLMDIIEMSTSGESAIDKVDSLLEIIGTHGSIIEDVVVYEDEEVSHVHTKNVMLDITRTF